MKTQNPANAGRRQGFDWTCFPATSNQDNTALQLIVQSEIDLVARLARRSGVHPITIKAQLDVWQIGGAHG